MRQHRWTFMLVIVVVVLLLLYSVAFTVDFKEVCIIKTFGSAGPPIHGATHAGLHWKWPWPIQSLVRYDARTFVFEDMYQEVKTNDNLNLLVTVFCGWRIHDADVFLSSIKTVAEAESTLRDKVRGAKSEVVGRHPMEHFVNTDPNTMAIEQIENEIRQKVSEIAMRDYGVEVVTIGIKALGLPKDVTKEVIENMKAERNREADSYRGSGQAIANAIRERAQTARNQIIEFAGNMAAGIRAKGDRLAAEYYGKFKGKESFAMFLRELEFLRETLQNNSVILLDASVLRSVGFFQEGPSLMTVKEQAAAAVKPPQQ